MNPAVPVRNAAYLPFTDMRKPPALTFFGLFALQHRGQESAGIVSSDGCQVLEHKGMGLASEVFKESNLQKLAGSLAIGHVRYSTTGSSTISNAQPFLVHVGEEYYALAHNGNIVNAQKLARRTGKQRFDFPINDGQRSHHPFDGAASEKGIGRSAFHRASTEWKALTVWSC